MDCTESFSPLMPRPWQFLVRRSHLPKLQLVTEQLVEHRLEQEALRGSTSTMASEGSRLRRLRAAVNPPNPPPTTTTASHGDEDAVMGDAGVVQTIGNVTGTATGEDGAMTDGSDAMTRTAVPLEKSSWIRWLLWTSRQRGSSSNHSPSGSTGLGATSFRRSVRPHHQFRNPVSSAAAHGQSTAGRRVHSRDLHTGYCHRRPTTTPSS